VTDLVTEITEEKLGAFAAVIAIPVAGTVGKGDIIVKAAIHPAGTDLAAKKTEAAAFQPDVRQRGVIAGKRNKIDGTAQTQRAKLQGVRAPIHLSVLDGADIEILQNDLAVALVQCQSIDEILYADGLVLGIYARAADKDLAHLDFVFREHD